MKQVDLADRLQQLNQIDSEQSLQISKYLENIILSAVLSGVQDGDKEVAVDIGIGKICIRVFNDAVIYQFVPSEQFQDNLKNMISTDQDPLIEQLNKKIDRKLKALYRELLR